MLFFLLVLNFVKAAVLFDQKEQNLSLDFHPNPGDKLCDQNDIYILDGERTLVITSHKPEIQDHLKIDKVNLRHQIENQDKIIEVCK